MAKLAWTHFNLTTNGTYEPKRKNNWYATIQTANGELLETIQIKSTGLPGGSFSEVEMKYMNSKYYFPGIWTWDTVEMTLRDFIGKNTTQSIYEWFLYTYNPKKGGLNYGVNVKKTINIYLLDTNGIKTDEWTLHGAWLQAAKWGEATYDDEQPREITVTIRYDYATHVGHEKAIVKGATLNDEVQ